MKLILIALLMSVCSGAKLDNHYLPPSNAIHSGGDGSILGAPHLRDRSQGLGPDSAPHAQYGTPGQQQYSPQLISSQGKPQTSPSRLYGSPQQPTAAGQQQQSGFSDSGVPSGSQGFASRFGSSDQPSSSYPQDRFSNVKSGHKTPSQQYGSPVKSEQPQNEYQNARTLPGQQTLSPRFGSLPDSSSGQPQGFSGSKLSQQTPSQLYGSPVGSVSGQTPNAFSKSGMFDSQHTPSRLYGTPETQSRFGQQEKPFTSAGPQQSAFNVPSNSQQYSGSQPKTQFGQAPQPGSPKHSTPFGTPDVHGPSDSSVSGFGPAFRSNQFKTTTGQNIPQYNNQVQGQSYPTSQQKTYQGSNAYEQPDTDSEHHLESRFGSGRTPNTYNQQVNPEQNAVILRQNSEVNFDGTYAFDFETSDGTAREENGHPEYTNSEEGDEVVSGSYRYTAPSGEVFTVEYIADKDGFHPTGDHLPTPPPIPDAILRSLEQNAAEDSLDGRARDNFSPQAQHTSGQYPTNDQNVKLGSRFGQNQQFESPLAKSSPSSGAHPQQSSISKTNLQEQGYTSGVPSYEQHNQQPQKPGQSRFQNQGFETPSQSPNLQSRFGNQQQSGSFPSSDQLRGYSSGPAAKSTVGTFGNEPRDNAAKHPGQKYPSSAQTYPTSADTYPSSRFENQQDKSSKYSPENISSQNQNYPSTPGRPFETKELKPRFGSQQTGQTYSENDQFSGYPSGPAKSNFQQTGAKTQKYPSATQTYSTSKSEEQYSPASRLSQNRDSYPEEGRPDQLSPRFGGQKPIDSLLRPGKKPAGIVSPSFTSESFGPGSSEEQSQQIEPRVQQQPNVFGTMQSKQGFNAEPKFGGSVGGFKGYPSNEDSSRFGSNAAQGYTGPSSGATKLQDRFGGSKTTPQQAFDPQSGYVY